MSNCYLDRLGCRWPHVAHVVGAEQRHFGGKVFKSVDKTVSHHLNEWWSTYGGQEKNSLPETCSVIVGLAGAILKDLSSTIVRCCQSNSHQCIDRFVHLTIVLWQMQWYMADSWSLSSLFVRFRRLFLWFVCQGSCHVRQNLHSFHTHHQISDSQTTRLQ